MTATVQQVGELLQRDITDELETRQVTRWIEYADMLIRRRYPNLDALIGDGSINSDAVDMVEAMAVARYALNPEGVTSRSTSIDDYQETQGLRNAQPGIVILDTEWALIAPKTTTAGTGAFTIVPAGRRNQW